MVSGTEPAYETAPIAVDIHSDMQLDLARHGGDPKRTYAERHLPGLEAGDVRVTVLSTVSGGDNPTASAVRNLGAARASGCRIVESGADLDADERVFVLGLEGAEPYQTDLDLVEAFHWLGIRIVQLAWVGANAVTGTCAQANPTGITPHGRAVLRRLHELGAIVDLAHISDEGFRDTLEVFDGPLMCSHTCARALCRHPRNVTDEQIRLLAEREGLIGVCFFGQFLDEDPSHRTLERVVDHAEHLVEVAGPDHVALGPDWLDYAVDVLEALSPPGGNVDVGSGFPPDLSGPEALPALFARMQERGLPAEQIFSLNALNFLRAWLW
jgi:membrane dipeptidase